MDTLTIATAQFENHNADKDYNLGVIENLTAKAAARNAQVIAFHEMCITGYTFTRKLSYEAMLDLAEYVPDGYSVQKLLKIARENNITVLAGLVEKDNAQKIYNTYVAVGPDGYITSFRKIHPFINQYLAPGESYQLFEINGWQCGILICYDNNIIENVRATTLLGAEVIFAPHVTGCTPSPMPGRGFVDKQLWDNRHNDPVPLRMEFDGPKARRWLLRWLPARAYDNGVYYVYSNPIGMDDDQLKPGGSMILDPYGEIMNEVRSFEDDFVVATITPDKLTLAGGYRYRNARKPELYRDILGAPHDPKLKPVWMEEKGGSKD